MSRETYQGDLSAASVKMCVFPLFSHEKVCSVIKTGVAFLHVPLVYLIGPDLLHSHPLGQEKVEASL